MLPHCPALLAPFILLVGTAYSRQINDDDDTCILCVFLSSFLYSALVANKGLISNGDKP